MTNAAHTAARFDTDHEWTGRRAPADAGPTFDVTITGQYVASEIPPRCRNPRDVVYDTQAVVSVPVVAAADAPVAFEKSSVTPDEEAIGERTWQVRLHDGRLYGPYRPFSGQKETSIAGDEHFPTVTTARWTGTRAATAKEFALEMDDQYAQFLIVDVDGVREVWAECGEPRYYTITFGIGRNHASTALFTMQHDNPNIKASSYFRADDFETARAHAIAVAQRRGDTDSVPGLEALVPEITVRIPEAVRLVVPTGETVEVEAARDALIEAARAYSRIMDYSTGAAAKDEAVAFKALTAARKALRALTSDVTGIEAERRPYEDR